MKPMDSITYNNIYTKICSDVRSEMKSLKTNINYLRTIDSVENVLRLQLVNSIRRKYNEK
jgi:hypothetical protein